MVFVCFLQLLLVSWVLIYISFFSFPKGERKKKRERTTSADQISIYIRLSLCFSPPETHTKAAHKMNNKEDGNKETAKKIMSNTHPTPSNICD